MRSTPARLIALALTASAAGLVAGCGGSGATSTADTAARQAAAAAPTFPAWTCEDFGSEDAISITFVNESQANVTLRAPEPGDCLPWSGSLTPGQVNAEGTIAPGASRTVVLAYDGLEDASGTTQRTPLGIELYLSDDESAWSVARPDFRFVRSVDREGRYIQRKVVLFVPSDGPGQVIGSEECSAVIQLPKVAGVFQEGVYSCAGKLVLGEQPPAGTFTVRSPAAG
jgi:hypothetical protein